MLERISRSSAAAATATPLLGPDDPPPFRWRNRAGDARVLLTCDHASNVIPVALGDLGLDAEARQRHIAWDIGAARIAERLSERLNAPTILAGFSRLVIDCNRHVHVPSSIHELSDGMPVPGNRGLSEAERGRRIAEIHAPYHAEIESGLEQLLNAGRTPIYVAVHTMTDRLADGHPRPWHASVCWARDDRLATRLKAALQREPDLNVGDNVPYKVDLGIDYSIPEHAMRRGLANAQIEIRQDLVADRVSAQHWGDRLADAIETLLPDDALFRLEPSWP